MAPKPISPRHKDCHNPNCPLANPPGHSITPKGYWRIHQRGEDRGKYLHRWVIEKLTGSVPGPDKEIHHIDLDQQHCCPYNLAVMDRAIHQAFDNSSRQQTTKGIKGFRQRPGANAEIDSLVGAMLAADWRGDKHWSVLKELDRLNPAQRQQGLFED